MSDKLRIVTQKGEPTAVYLYGVIGDEWGGVTADQFRKELSAIPSKQPIDLHIHSDGGSFFDGVAIHSQLRQRSGDVSVIVDGLAASAASLIAMAGKSITMAQHSWMMIHEAQGMTFGRASDFRRAADQLDSVNSEIVSIYAGRWNGDEKELRAALDGETWLSAEQSVEAGLADGVSASLAVAAAVDWSKFKYSKVPKTLLEAKTDILPGLVAIGAAVDELFADVA